MSLYSQYIKEREGKEVLETEYGFATYEINSEECYIQDIYVVPSKRRSQVGTDMADWIKQKAKDKGCKFLLGSVCPDANNSHASLQALMSYGMKLYKVDKGLVWFIKRIE